MSDRTARVLAQAKINVFLHVHGPRPDGYHELLTLFQRLDLADEITIRASSGTTSRSLDLAGPRLPSEGLGPVTKNLAYRAAAEFHARTGWPRGFEIGLTKNIPVGGGLGGGSADAAAVVRALNALAPAPLEPTALHELAAALGSDVPFLVTERVAAIAGGRGEVLEPTRVRLPSADVLVAVPSFSVGTADAYRWLRESGRYRRDDQRRAGEIASASRWSAMDLGNAFEPVVEGRHPELRDYREKLGKAGATIARMSGSGSTVFGLFESGVPGERELEIDVLVLRTRTAEHVVQVEAQE